MMANCHLFVKDPTRLGSMAVIVAPRLIAPSNFICTKYEGKTHHACVKQQESGSVARPKHCLKNREAEARHKEDCVT